MQLLIPVFMPLGTKSIAVVVAVAVAVIAWSPMFCAFIEFLERPVFVIGSVALPNIGRI